MSNADLIERLRHNPTLDLFAKAADALELADKRIAELEEAIDANWVQHQRVVYAERKLAVAREALEFCWRDVPMSEYAFDLIEQALAQIGGEDESG